MEYKGIIYDIINMAKKDKKRIVLPEATDIRVLKAANIIQKENIADVILVGDKENIEKIALENNIDISDIIIKNNLESSKLDEYANKLFKLRERKGLTLKNSYELLKDEVYFATMMINENDADGMVSGAIHTTSDTLRPALQIIKTRKNVNSVSSFFIMQTQNKQLGENGKFIFSDCGLIVEPTEDEMVDIITESYNSFKTFIKKEPKIALLSYSTKGSAKIKDADKVKNVISKVKEKNKNILIDGEFQLDAAIIKDVAKIKVPKSKVAGEANVLIFPNLESGNIGYKIAQRFGNMLALGPITQGLNKPVNDLSRGCSVEDIIGVAAITCVQASNNK